MLYAKQIKDKHLFMLIDQSLICIFKKNYRLFSLFVIQCNIKLDIMRLTKIIRRYIMIKYLQSKTFKMALSATISVLISNYIGFEFAVTSGIIAILSIQDTKKEAVRVSIKRFLASTIAILLSFLLYVLLGNNPVIFGLFLLIFIPLTLKFKIDDGMVVGAVLSTHLLTSTNINIHWIINEVGLTIIGISGAMIFNLYNVSLEEDFEKNKNKIEEQYRLILLNLSTRLITQESPENGKKIFEFVERIIYETKIWHKE